MSASNKKQQRKAEMADTLTQRERKDQAEAQAAKRKRTLYTAVGVICAVVAVALLVWNNLGNASHGGAVAATLNGVDYTVDDLRYYYMSARNQVATYAQYGMYSYNVNQADGAQWYNEEEGQTYADYFRQSALESLKQTAVVCNAAKEAGYTLSSAGQKQIDNSLATIDQVCARYNMTRSSYFARQYGISEKVFLRNLTNDVLADEYLTYYEDNISYDDAALQEYYTGHADTLDSYDYRMFAIDGTAPSTLDDDGNTVPATDEENAQAMTLAKVKAEQALAEIQAAGDTEKAFIEAAPKYVSDTAKDAYADASYSLHTEVQGSNIASTSMGAWLTDPARKTGDVTTIETSTSYQVVLFLKRYLVTDPTVDIRHILIRAEMPVDDPETADVDESKGLPTQEAMDAAKAEAQSLMDQWNAGEKTAESFGALAEEHSDDGGSNTNGGKYTFVPKGQMVPNFDAWIFDPARQPGDVGLVENTGEDATYHGWHVIYFEKVEEPYWKGVAIDAKQATDRSEWLSGLVDAATVVEADGMQYVGDANTAQPTPSESPAESPDPSESPAA